MKGATMYVDPNFKTKKAFKEAISAGQKVSVFSPGMFPAKTDGTETIEGPHYPKPHTWYAQVQVKNVNITSKPVYRVGTSRSSGRLGRQRRRR